MEVPKDPSPMSALAERPAGLPLAESRSLSGARPWRSIAIASDMAAIEAEWRALEARALVTPYQSYGWVQAFVATVGAAHDMAFRHVVLRDAAGIAQAILPLTITH